MIQDLEKIITTLVDKKAREDNRIDLNAYENGMRALAKELNKSDEILSIGDTVAWRGAWGLKPAEDAVVDHIEINCENKCGTPVEEFPWSGIFDRTVIVSLTNGSWAYGNQINKK